MCTGHNSAYVGGYTGLRARRSSMVSMARLSTGMAAVSCRGVPLHRERLLMTRGSTSRSRITLPARTTRSWATTAAAPTVGTPTSTTPSVPTSTRIRGPNEPSAHRGKQRRRLRHRRGDNTIIEYDCLIQDAQGAFNGSVVANIRITDNEISRDGLGEYPDNPRALVPAPCVRLFRRRETVLLRQHQDHE